MKKTLILMFLCLTSALSALAQGITFHRSDGSQVYVAFADNPVLRFEGDKAIITTDKTTVEVALSQMETATVENSATPVEGIVSPALADGSVEYSREAVTLSGALAGETLDIYSTDGRCVMHAEAGADGMATLSLAGLQPGAYIIKTKTENYKILKR